MIITLCDKTESVNEHFLQSLVLMYLPCESFSTKNANDTKRLDVFVEKNEEEISVTIELASGERKERIRTSCKRQDGKRLQIKNFVGRTFMKCAKAVFGYESPWGIVTGIRPAKLAVEYLKDYSPQETKQILEKEYLISPERAEACIKTAIKEQSLVSSLGEKSCSLYVSIPFCPSKCRYCSFVSSTTPRLLSLIPQYTELLKKELCDISKTVRELGLELNTIYIGGGTPGILSAEQTDSLVSHINNVFDTSKLAEFTFEAGRPDCISKEKLEVLKKTGVNRISINTQSANDAVLASVGRKHTFEDYKKCMYLAREAGISCINTDLIAGLPGESTESFKESVEKVIDEGPENITVHSFTLKRSSEYKTENTAGVDASSLSALEMVSFSCEKLISSGYNPYYMYRQKNTVGNLDNTGYATENTECLYNVYMMGEYHTVFGAGAGAVSKYVSENRRLIKRAFNPKYPYEYLDKEKFKGFDAEFANDFYKNIYEG